AGRPARGHPRGRPHGPGNRPRPAHRGAEVPHQQIPEGAAPRPRRAKPGSARRLPGIQGEEHGTGSGNAGRGSETTDVLRDPRPLRPAGGGAHAPPPPRRPPNPRPRGPARPPVVAGRAPPLPLGPARVGREDEQTPPRLRGVAAPARPPADGPRAGQPPLAAP